MRAVCHLVSSIVWLYDDVEENNTKESLFQFLLPLFSRQKRKEENYFVSHNKFRLWLPSTGSHFHLCLRLHKATILRFDQKEVKQSAISILVARLD